MDDFSLEAAGKNRNIRYQLLLPRSHAEKERALASEIVVLPPPIFTLYMIRLSMVEDS